MAYKSWSDRLCNNIGDLYLSHMFSGKKQPKASEEAQKCKDACLKKDGCNAFFLAESFGNICNFFACPYPVPQPDFDVLKYADVYGNGYYLKENKE